MRHRLACLLIMVLALAGFPSITAAAEKSPDPEKSWSIEARIKRYFNSHTTYQFGNPDPPNQAPLSRLEFPMNVWWAGGEVRRSFSRFSVRAEVLRNISLESDHSMQDSDWSTDAQPGVKDIYSESQCRVEPSYMVRGDVDLKIADWVGLPVWFDLRPVVGVRWQYLNFVAHNGVQIYPAPWDTTPPDHLPGDVIRFQQIYWQYFLGIRMAYDLGRHFGGPRLKLNGQLDWAYVSGDNEDHHLLRQGKRMTYEKTRGDAYHASLGIKAGLTQNIDLGLEVEYLQIMTTGSHHWVHDVIAADMSWDNGVKVWSKQMNVMMSLEYMF